MVWREQGIECFRHRCFSLVYGGIVSGSRFKRTVFPAKTWNDGLCEGADKKAVDPVNSRNIYRCRGTYLLCGPLA